MSREWIRDESILYMFLNMQSCTLHDADHLAFFESSILADSIFKLLLQVDENVVVGKIQLVLGPQEP